MYTIDKLNPADLFDLKLGDIVRIFGSDFVVLTPDSHMGFGVTLVGGNNPNLHIHLFVEEKDDDDYEGEALWRFRKTVDGTRDKNSTPISELGDLVIVRKG